MKIGVRPESLLEQSALWLGLAPVPLVETHAAANLARAIMAGVELGLFDALAEAPLDPRATAARCGTSPEATGLLMGALASSGYLRRHGEAYGLTRQSRKWLLTSSRAGVRDKILLQALEWRWLEGLESFVRTGRPLDFHAAMTDEERALYHRSMLALARIAGPEVALRTPTPRGARLMLDLGGSHGHYAAAICRRHPGLKAEVLDLPEAVRSAAPMLAAEGLGERLTHVAGDAAHDDLGRERYDLVLMSNLAHHLDDGENRALARRVARSLRPGGWFVIQEPARPERAGRDGQTGALLGLYFALQSRPGVRTWSIAEMAGWQSAAGLRPAPAVRMLTAPGWVQQAAVRAPVTSARALRSPAGPASAPAG